MKKKAGAYLAAKVKLEVCKLMSSYIKCSVEATSSAIICLLACISVDK